MGNNKYIPVKELIAYLLARKLSSIAWNIYSKMSFEDKKHIGDQFLRSTGSIGAIIKEGYGRLHYLDKVRFYYDPRASHSEATDQLLFERN